MQRTNAPVWLVFAASILVPFAILAIGFRILYDSVIPEVGGLVLTGVMSAYLRPRHAWLWVIGIAIGIALSERAFRQQSRLTTSPDTAHQLRLS